MWGRDMHIFTQNASTTLDALLSEISFSPRLPPNKLFINNSWLSRSTTYILPINSSLFMDGQMAQWKCLMYTMQIGAIVGEIQMQMMDESEMCVVSNLPGCVIVLVVSKATRSYSVVQQKHVVTLVMGTMVALHSLRHTIQSYNCDIC